MDKIARNLSDNVPVTKRFADWSAEQSCHGFPPMTQISHVSTSTVQMASAVEINSWALDDVSWSSNTHKRPEEPLSQFRDSQDS